MYPLKLESKYCLLEPHPTASGKKRLKVENKKTTPSPLPHGTDK